MSLTPDNGPNVSSQLLQLGEIAPEKALRLGLYILNKDCLSQGIDLYLTLNERIVEELRPECQPLWNAGITSVIIDRTMILVPVGGRDRFDYEAFAKASPYISICIDCPTRVM